MEQIQDQIGHMDADQLYKTLRAILRRYGELFPEWEVNVFSIHKGEDLDGQFQAALQLLRQLHQRDLA